MSDLPAEIDSSTPHAARIYDYFLGGTNNFAADRAAAAEVSSLGSRSAAWSWCRPVSCSCRNGGRPMRTVSRASRGQLLRRSGAHNLTLVRRAKNR